MADIVNPTEDATIWSADGTKSVDVNTDKEALVHDQHAIDLLSTLATGVENDLIHKGKAWTFTPAGITTIAKQANLDILISVGASEITLRDMSVNVNKNASSGSTEAQLFAGATTSANGTEVYPWNNRRSNTTETFTGHLYTGPTITGAGTKLIDYLVHSDWETYIAPSYTTPYEIILKANTKYIFRIYNNMQQAIDVTFFMFFYQEF